MKPKIGLIAGNGQLPFLIVEEALKLGHDVYVSAIKGEADPLLEAKVTGWQWVYLGELGRPVKFFKQHEVRQAVMAGKITKTNLFRGDIRPDLEMIKMLATRKNHSDDSLLGGIVNYFNSHGVEILETTKFLSESALPEEGVLTKRKPTKEELTDIEFGWQLAKEMGRVDVGQTVVVKKQAVLAVEAVEGTDEAIKRGGVLGHGDVVVVKVSKPKQDMRFDVPTVGMGTLESLKEARAKVLAIEAGKTIVVDMKKFIDEANRAGISVVCRK